MFGVKLLDWLTLKMKALFKTVGTAHPTPQHHISEDFSSYIQIAF
jgi:hypothetical protein